MTIANKYVLIGTVGANVVRRQSGRDAYKNIYFIVEAAGAATPVFETG